MENYFNTLSLREQLSQLGKCDFMDSSEFKNGVTILKGKKIVIIGCGAQGLSLTQTCSECTQAQPRRQFLRL